MKKSKGIKAIAIFTISFALLISIMMISGWFVFDHSAEFFFGIEEKRLYWKGATYVPCGGVYEAGRTIAKTSDNRVWNIKAVKEDSSHTFVSVNSFIDYHALFVREDYVIPQSGKVTAVCWKDYSRSKEIKDLEFCQAVGEIHISGSETFEYEHEVPHGAEPMAHMKNVYIAYEGCPVGTIFVGLVGEVNGQWIVAKQASPSPKYNAETNSYNITYTCKRIPREYISIIEKFICA